MTKAVIIRGLITTIIVSLITTLIAAQVFKTVDITTNEGMTTLFILLIVTSMASVLVTSYAAYGRSSQINQPNPIIAYNSRETGIVKWFNTNKGFGFITRDTGDDVFVHFRSIRGQGHRTLIEGQRVEFNVTEGEKGLQAEDVAIAS